MARSFGSAEELERRRRLAVSRVIDDDVPVIDVAQEQRVTPRIVHMWVREAREKGEGALASTPHPGRTPKLTAKQEKQVLGWFTRSPTEFGYPNELWTGPRVAEQILKHFGVEFNPRYILHWLRVRGITPQKPETFARERDDKEIRRWVRVELPRIVKKRGN